MPNRKSVKAELSKVSADYWIFKPREGALIEPLDFQPFAYDDLTVKMSRLTMSRRSLPNSRAQSTTVAQVPRILGGLTSRTEPLYTHRSLLVDKKDKVRGHNNKKVKKKVRLKLPNETSQAPSPLRLDPFENNWLVDTPRVILSEKTMVDLKSPLQSELEGFHEDVAHVPDEEYELVEKEGRLLMNFIARRIAKMDFTNGLKIEKHIFTGSTYERTQSVYILDVDVFLVFSLHPKAKIESLQPGYQMIKLPKFKERDGGAPDPWTFGRSEDGSYLSCRMIAWLFYGIIDSALRTRPSAVLQPFTIQEGKSQIIVTVNDRYHFHIMPAAWDDNLESYLVTRPYINDENPFSDMMWRYNFSDTEKTMFNAMAIADRGSRIKVYQIFKALIRLEHTLEGLEEEHIKTVLLSLFDADIDNTPRWQRGSLENCFKSVLKELRGFLTRRNMPHFFVKGQNLFDNMTDRTWNNLKNRVSFLASNDRECVRILKKRTRLTIDPLGRAITDSVTSTQTV